LRQSKRSRSARPGLLEQREQPHALERGAGLRLTIDFARHPEARLRLWREGAQRVGVDRHRTAHVAAHGQRGGPGIGPCRDAGAQRGDAAQEQAPRRHGGLAPCVHAAAIPLRLSAGTPATRATADTARELAGLLMRLHAEFALICTPAG